MKELMDAYMLGQKIVANNMANLNTPGYRTMRLRFADALERVLTEDGRLVPGKHVETEVYRPMFGDADPSGNDVQLAREMAELNKNMLRMKMLLAVLRYRIRVLRMAAGGR